MKITFSVPDNSDLATWMKNQVSRPYSIRVLLTNAVSQLGTDDLMSTLLSQSGFGISMNTSAEMNHDKQPTVAKKKIEKQTEIVSEKNDSDEVKNDDEDEVNEEDVVPSYDGEEYQSYEEDIPEYEDDNMSEDDVINQSTNNVNPSSNDASDFRSRL